MNNLIRYLHLVCVFSLLALLSGCAVQPAKLVKYDYSQFRQENPRSILVVPAINKSIDVDAPDYFLSTIVRPLAERGYYVFPVRVVQQVMNDDGLSDADMVHSSDPVRLATLFGADAVLYVSINQWDAKYIVLSTEVTVDLSYVLKSGKTGETLWTGSAYQYYSTNKNNNSSGSLLGLLIESIHAAIERASPSHIPLAKEANYDVVYRRGKGLPAGPYDVLYLKDQDNF